jgi:copper chaperone NosL
VHPGAALRRGLTLALLLAACGEPGPVPIAWGERECDYCHMTAVQPQYAAQLVLRTGKVLVFDDPGCLASFVREGSVAAEAVHSMWLNDFLAPDAPPLRVEEAIFVRSDSLRTPMNHGVAALRPGPSADSLRTALGGTLVRWEDVMKRET